MIIQGSTPGIQNIAKAYGTQAKTNQVKKPSSTSSLQGADQVTLSPAAQGFSQILQKLKNTPEVREDKVAEMREKMSAGTYQINNDEIAAKLLSGMGMVGR